MDFLERKVLEIIQTNNEISKEEIMKTEDPIINANKGINVLEKVSGNLNKLNHKLNFNFLNLVIFI